jgi:hypothetical protein
MAATQFSRPCTIWDCLDDCRPLGGRIDDERRRLQKASAVLMALECALNEDGIEPIVAADAANVARGLIEHAVTRLDGVSLARGARPAAAEGNVSRQQAEVVPQATEGIAQDDTDDEEEEDDPDADEDDDDEDI